jgi:hypothetical protein
LLGQRVAEVKGEGAGEHGGMSHAA